MTILVTADWHVSENPRDNYRWLWLRKLPKLLQKHKVDLLLVLGDLSEAKGRHEAELVNQLVDIFRELAEICPVVVLQGNHDGFSADNPFFRFLEAIERVSWVGRPTPSREFQNVPVFCQKALGRGAIFLPHSPSPERDWTKLDLKSYDWAFTHQCYENSESESGFKLPGTPLSVFPRGLKVISGDIHKPQTVGPVTYVGSPYAIDFGDSFEPRVLLINDKGQLQSLLCEGPQKRLVEIKSVSELKAVKGLSPEDILKVRVEIAPAQHAEWPEIVTKVRAWGLDNKYDIYAVQPNVKAERRSMSKVRKDAPKRSDVELLREYAQRRQVDEKTLKAGETLL